MKTMLGIIVGLTLFLGPVPKEAECASCMSVPCYGSCGAGCACMKKGLDTKGVCVSFDRADDLIAEGWEHF